MFTFQNPERASWFKFTSNTSREPKESFFVVLCFYTKTTWNNLKPKRGMKNKCWNKESMSINSGLRLMVERLFVERLCVERLYVERLFTDSLQSFTLKRGIIQMLPTLKNGVMLHFYKVSVNILEEVLWVHSALSLSKESCTAINHLIWKKWENIFAELIFNCSWVNYDVVIGPYMFSWNCWYLTRDGSTITV